MKQLKLKFVFSIIFFMTMSTLFAQYNLDDYFPDNKKNVKGVLPNGITYYLRHNKEPKNRASFYIIRNAGAILEEDNENGLAHFLEHMAFNGTNHFPKKGIISTLEKYGVKFGANLNAYTSTNETVYNISDVPVNIENIIDTCLLILKDWTYDLSLLPEDIDAERRVISEEWRQRRDAASRVREKVNPILLKGSKYAVRDVIGSFDVINNFEYDLLKGFYQKWYRTDLTAIAIVGDFDPKEVEKKIIAMFSDIPANKNPEPLPFFDIPEHEDFRFVVVTDKELRNSGVELVRIMRNATTPEDMTYNWYRNSLIESFYNSMIRQRFSEVMQKPNPPFQSARIGYSGYNKGYNAYIISATATPNEEAKALKAILTENERIIRHGFMESELDRVKSNMLAQLESNYKQRDKIKNEAYINPMKSNFLMGTPMPNDEDYYKFAKAVIPTITAAEVSEKAGLWNLKDNWTLVISGPENHVHLTQEEVFLIVKEIENSDAIAPYEDEIGVTKDLIDEELTGSDIVNEKRLPEFEAVEWTLRNGAKVIFRKADYEKDRVSLIAFSEGGTSLYDTDMLPAAQNAAGFVSSFGVGDFNPVMLSKKLAGKLIDVKVNISSLFESVSGSCAPKDFETMMQMVYMRFVHPRYDDVLYNNTMERARNTLENKYKNPQAIIKDSLSLILTNHHPRTKLFNEEFFNDISLEKIRAVYVDRIKDASDFTFIIVGNIEEEEVKLFSEKYIGSIPAYERSETWMNHKVGMPKGKTEKKIAVPMEVPKSQVFVIFSKEMDYSPYNAICASILKDILQLRYTESIRGEQGGTYGVSVSANPIRIPDPKCEISMNFACDPDRAETLKPLIYEELDNIIKNGPKSEDLDKVLSSIRKNREHSKPHNNYWLNAIYGYYLSGINNDDPENFENILNTITVAGIKKWAADFCENADIVDIIFFPEKPE